MKKTVGCLLLFLLALKTYSQKKDFFSFEADANYYYYQLGDIENFSKQKFSYGFSLHAAMYINKFKLNVGINYSTRTLMVDESSWWPFDVKQRKYRFEYRNFPVLANIEYISKQRFTSSVLLGFIISNNTVYEITTFYMNGSVKTENAKAKGYTDSKALFILGNTFSIPLGHTKPLEDMITLNFQPSIGIQITHTPYDPKYGSYYNVPSGLLTFGFKIGIEYLFRVPQFTRFREYLKNVDYP